MLINLLREITIIRPAKIDEKVIIMYYFYFFFFPPLIMCDGYTRMNLPYD